MLGATVIVITNLCDQYGETVRFGPYESPRQPFRVSGWLDRLEAGLAELNDELLPGPFATTQLKAAAVLASGKQIEATELPSAESVIHDIRTGWQAGELALYIKAPSPKGGR